jgi:threonine/homoserine efflux transporter RhtA
MSAYLALATSVGLLAVLDTWLFFGPLSTTLVAGLVWVSFIAWGCHFQSGGGTKGATTAAVCMSWGAIVGMVSVMLANGPLGSLDSAVGVAIAVGIGAAVICLSSAISLLSTIPASVYGFASIAGSMVLRGDAPEAAVLPTIVAVIIGAAFGYVSEILANALTKKNTAEAAS